jgi:hypothetical protein
VIANKTLALIDSSMRVDQGAKYRTLLRDLMPLAEDAYRGEEPPFRSHLGASQLGRKCGRDIWYSFRWATNKQFSGEMLRLFNRGHLEEPRMIALLKMIGVTTYQLDARGKQFRISKGHKGHGGGGMDAVLYGVPEMPDRYMLGEFKTHNDASFTKLLDGGVIKAKWEHFVQCQMYMGDQKLPNTLYLATNKNNDAIHAEIIDFDPMQHKRYEQRSIMLIDAREAPPKIGKDETSFDCKFCDHVPVCHLGKAPVRTCRSCKHVQVALDSKWVCTLHQEFRTSEEQLAACPQYEIMPGFYAKP